MITAARLKSDDIPMSLLAKHLDVQFNFYKGALADIRADLH